MEQKGKLFLCATPIGNLEDVTLRLVSVLQSADIVAAEDTSHTKKLLNHLGIQKKLISYHEHNKEKRGSELIRLMLDGKSVALVSDAGYPGIADPGEQLVKLSVDEGIDIVPLPGANAALSALVASGIETTPFFFGGFLPKTKKHRQEKLRMWQQVPATMIFYEAPHRIEQVLAQIHDSWGDRRIVLARELTKVYEEFFRGNITQALSWLKQKPPRGEFTIIIEKGQQREDCPEISAFEKLKQLLKQGEDKKESLKKVAKEYNMSKRELYRYLLDEETSELLEGE